MIHPDCSCSHITLEGRSYLLSVKVKVNGEKIDANFIVDSGSEINVVAKNLVEKVERNLCGIKVRGDGRHEVPQCG